MEEKSIMTKSGKTIPKKRKPNTTSLLVDVEQQMIPSRKVFDAIPLAIVSVDWKGQIQYMNKAARSMLGEPGELLKPEDWPQRFGLYLDDGLIPYPADKLPLVRALRGEVGGEAEEIILRKEGDARGIWISMSAEILRDENGNIDGAITLIRDIDYRKQIELSREKHVKRTEALYSFSHAISEAGNDLSMIMNLTAKFVAEVVGDLSVIALLNADGDKLKIKAYHDTNPTAYSLLRKIYGTDFEF